MKTKQKKSWPSREPQYVSGTTWYYEHASHLEFVVECRANGRYHQTIQFKVPLATIRASLARIGGEK